MSAAYASPTAQTRRWIQALHEDEDLIAFLVIRSDEVLADEVLADEQPGDRAMPPGADRRADRRVVQRTATVETILSDRWMRWIRHENAKGANVYLSVNPLRPGCRRRRKEDVREARVIVLDIDTDGDRKLERVLRELAPPTLLVRTRPGRYQVLWRLTQAVEPAWAEAVMGAMAREYGADVACSDIARVFRVPGFSNAKETRRRPRPWATLLDTGRRVAPEVFAAFAPDRAARETDVPAEGARAPRESRAISEPAATTWLREVLERLGVEDSGARTRIWGAFRGEIESARWSGSGASERDYMLMAELHRAGATEVDLRRALVLAGNRRTSKGHAMWDDYVSRTIAAARAKVEAKR